MVSASRKTVPLAMPLIPRSKLPTNNVMQREWIPAGPDFSKRATQAYWRLIFLTRHNVWFRNLYDDNHKHIGALLHSVKEYKISVCVQHMLFQKGFPVKDAVCKRDSCFTCRPELSRRIKM